MEEREKQEIIKEVVKRVSILNKKVLTSQEAAAYLGISLSKLYKFTCAKEIPHYKPNGKLNYFERAEIEAWALRNKVSIDEPGMEECTCPLVPGTLVPGTYNIGPMLDKLAGDDPARRNLVYYLLKKPLLKVVTDRAYRDIEGIRPSIALMDILRKYHVSVGDAIYICSHQENVIDSRDKAELRLILSHLGLM